MPKNSQAVFEYLKILAERMSVELYGEIAAAIGKEEGRNPATGEEAILPARRVVTFKCSGKLRERVNGRRRELG